MHVNCPFTTQNLILIGVVLHLLLSAAKLIFKTPKQQAQIDALAARLEAVLALLPGGTQAMQAVQKPNPEKPNPEKPNPVDSGKTA